ncbi:unnamed protein product [Cunninghamella blakesleeana]
MIDSQYFSHTSKKHIQDHEGSIKLKWRHLIAEKLSTLFSNDIPVYLLCNNMESKQGYFALSLHRIKRYLTTEPWTSFTINDFSEWIISKLVPDEWIEKIETSGSFINFTIRKSIYMESILQQIIMENDTFGLNKWDKMDCQHTNSNNNENNLNKEIIITLDPSFSTTSMIDSIHFRALIISQFLKRIANNNKVQLLNTLSIWNSEFGYMALALEKKSDQINTYDDLIDFYLKIKEEDNNEIDIDNYLLKLEQGHNETYLLYQQIEKLYNQYYQQICDRLSFYFDSTICVTPLEVQSFYQLLKEKCDKSVLLITKTDDDHENEEWKIDLRHVGLDTPLIRDRKGLSTPLTRNILQILTLYQSLSPSNNMFEIYNITEQSRSKFIQQVHYIVFEIILPFYASSSPSSPSITASSIKKNWINIPIGMVNNSNNESKNKFHLIKCLNSSQKIMMNIMEENKGSEKYDTVIDQLSQLVINENYDHDKKPIASLKTSSSSIQQLIEKHADLLGISALFIHYLAQRRNKPFISFLQLSESDIYGNSGVFLQYVHARISGIQRQIKGRLSIPSDADGADMDNNENKKILGNLHSLLLNSDGKLSLYQPEAFDIIDLLGQFPQIITQSKSNLDPSLLVHYLFKLARLTNQTLYNMRIKDVSLELAQIRWLLFWAVKRSLGNGLIMLGIEPLEWM